MTADYFDPPPPFTDTTDPDTFRCRSCEGVYPLHQAAPQQDWTHADRYGSPRWVTCQYCWVLPRSWPRAVRQVWGGGLDDHTGERPGARDTNAPIRVRA